MAYLKLVPNVIKVDDTDHFISLYASEKGHVVDFTENDITTLKIGNQTGFLKDIALTNVDGQLVFSSMDLKELPADIYTAELWVNRGDKVRIYPSDGKAKFKLAINILATTGETVPAQSIDQIEKRLDDKLKNLVINGGGKGEDGKDGKDGKSAYQIWLDAGNTGTEQEFIASLKGVNGNNGADGKSAYQIWLDSGHSGTEQEFLISLKGEKGATGDNGKDGESAYQIWLDAGNQGTEQQFLASLKGQDGERGNDGANGQSAYQIWLANEHNGTEQDFLNSLKGEKGEDGNNGDKGSDGKSAYQVWLDLGNSGTEQDFINSLKGPNGKDGKDGKDATAEKRPATALWVDLNDTQNIVGRFDNGCWVELRTAARWSPILSTGSAGYQNIQRNAPIHDQCWENVLSFLNGTLAVNAFKAAQPAIYEYWKNCLVHEPYNDVDQYDWTNARLTSTGSDVGEVDFMKMMFAVGLFTEATVLSCGATKKQ